MSNTGFKLMELSKTHLQFPKRSSINKRSDSDIFDQTEIAFSDLDHQNIITTGYDLNRHASNSTVAIDDFPSPTQDLTDQELTVLEDEDLEFPEGGLKAYLAVLGCFMGLVPAFGLINSVGAIEVYVSAHQLSGVSSSTVSWIFSIYIFFASACGIFSGAFFDRNGAFYPLLIGTVFFCGGMFATGNATTVYQFILSFGVVTGFGNGMLISPLVGVVSHYFSKKRATYSSLATTGGSIGGIVFPLLLRKLYPAVGFAWALRILSFVCLFCLVFAMIFARERLEAKNQPQIRNYKDFIKIYILDILQYKAFMETRFLFCSFGVGLAESSLVVASVYFPSYAIKRGFNSATSYLLITVINTTGILGRYIPGYVSDKWLGRFNVVILTLLGCTLCSMVLWLPFGYSLTVLYVYSALYGFCSGSILSLSPVCVGQISKTEEFGKRYSTMYILVSFTMLAAIPIGGAIIDDAEIHNYNNFIIYASMLSLGGCICYFISRTASVGLRLCKF